MTVKAERGEADVPGDARRKLYRTQYRGGRREVENGAREMDNVSSPISHQLPILARDTLHKINARTD